MNSSKLLHTTRKDGAFLCVQGQKMGHTFSQEANFKKVIFKKSRKHSLKSSLYYAYQEKCCFHLEMFDPRH